MGVEQFVPPTNWVGSYCNTGKGVNQQKIRVYFLKYSNLEDILTFGFARLTRYVVRSLHLKLLDKICGKILLLKSKQAVNSYYYY